jgi:hypothetical protein
MALHGKQDGDTDATLKFDKVFKGQGLGNSVMQEKLTAFQPIVNGFIP